MNNVNEQVTLGASHLASDGYEVQRTNNFEVILSGIGDITGNVNNTNRITLAVESFFLPQEDSAVHELNFSNMVTKVAGTTTYTGGSLVVKDIISATSDIESIIVAWRKAVYNPKTDQVGLAFNYKREGTVIQYAPDGTMQRTWKLKGVWPKSARFGNLEYKSGGAVKTIDVAIEFDKAIRDDITY